MPTGTLVSSTKRNPIIPNHMDDDIMIKWNKVGTKSQIPRVFFSFFLESKIVMQVENWMT